MGTPTIVNLWFNYKDTLPGHPKPVTSPIQLAAETHSWPIQNTPTSRLPVSPVSQPAWSPASSRWLGLSFSALSLSMALAICISMRQLFQRKPSKARLFLGTP